MWNYEDVMTVHPIRLIREPGFIKFCYYWSKLKESDKMGISCDKMVLLDRSFALRDEIVLNAGYDAKLACIEDNAIAYYCRKL